LKIEFSTEVDIFENNYIKIQAGRDLLKFNEEVEITDDSGSALNYSLDLTQPEITSIQVFGVCSTCPTVSLTLSEVLNPSFVRPASSIGARQSLSI